MGLEVSDENCRKSRKPGQSRTVETIGYAGFRRKKIEGEHGKLTSNGAIKRTGVNCSLLLCQEE